MQRKKELLHIDGANVNFVLHTIDTIWRAPKTQTCDSNLEEEETMD